MGNKADQSGGRLTTREMLADMPRALAFERRIAADRRQGLLARWWINWPLFGAFPPLVTIARRALTQEAPND